MLALCALTACGDDGDLGTDRLRAIDTVSPSTARQGEVVRLLGAGFGAEQPERAGAWVGGVCTTITGWSDNAVTIVIPSGTGLGEKLIVLMADGRVSDPIPVTLTGTALNDNVTYCDESGGQ